uniref:Uncharacterized protein n=1 Tax=Arundo donax TaxID=35708 RepID=A0A0A9FFZ4_ARUDO
MFFSTVFLSALHTSYLSSVCLCAFTIYMVQMCNLPNCNLNFFEFNLYFLSILNISGSTLLSFI